MPLFQEEDTQFGIESSSAVRNITTKEITDQEIQETDQA